MAHRLGALVSWERQQVAATCVRSLADLTTSAVQAQSVPRVRAWSTYSGRVGTVGISVLGTPDAEHSEPGHIGPSQPRVGFRPH
jgi:hypothetical protein